MPFATEADFADPERALWRADLVLDIDHIVEWMCGTDKRMRSRVAPATLAFHNVTDLMLAIDWGDSGHQTALHSMGIDSLVRKAVTDQKICFDRLYYRWTITLNWPKAGRIAFGASGFALTLRAPPIHSDQQQLSPLDRGTGARTNPRDLGTAPC